MTNDHATPDARRAKLQGAQAPRDFVSIVIGDQLFGIPVLQVQDVLGPQRITRIPLGLPELSDGKKRMSIVVDLGGELYSLMVDSVGEVLSLGEAAFERNPATLD